MEVEEFVKRMNSEIKLLKNCTAGDLQSWKTVNLWGIYLLNGNGKVMGINKFC